jgi:hypothetical protein
LAGGALLLAMIIVTPDIVRKKVMHRVEKVTPAEPVDY